MLKETGRGGGRERERERDREKVLDLGLSGVRAAKTGNRNRQVLASSCQKNKGLRLAIKEQTRGIRSNEQRVP